ncbi:MAG: hypothetical protein QGD92_00555 [Gammaproteobacteria bacterium]|nr:hypothetical protein [Gammaproteobacteria bacterium]
MVTTTFGKGLLLFFMMVISLAVNLDDNLITRLGLDMNYGLIAFVALVTAFLAAGRNLKVIFMIGILSLIVNMPVGFILNFGIDREVYFGLMASIVSAPFVAWLFDA